MAIDLAHRSDLERGAEELADRFGLRGRGRKTTITERALAAFSGSEAQDDQEQLAIEPSIARFVEARIRLRTRLAKGFPSVSAPLAASQQQAVYDESGLPEWEWKR